MARDGLIPESLSRLKSLGAPTILTLIVGGFVAVIAGLFRLDQIAELSNAGTLLAFIAVSVCVLVLRVRSPDAPRPFRCPVAWVVAPLAVIGCLYFAASLPLATLVRFAAWNAVGAVIYLAYGRRKSSLAKPANLLHSV
jgi:APA family basic amino acid/polyamine antiporter